MQERELICTEETGGRAALAQGLQKGAAAIVARRRRERQQREHNSRIASLSAEEAHWRQRIAEVCGMEALALLEVQLSLYYEWNDEQEVLARTAAKGGYRASWNVARRAEKARWEAERLAREAMIAEEDALRKAIRKEEALLWPGILEACARDYDEAHEREMERLDRQRREEAARKRAEEMAREKREKEERDRQKAYRDFLQRQHHQRERVEADSINGRKHARTEQVAELKGIESLFSCADPYFKARQKLWVMQQMYQELLAEPPVAALDVNDELAYHFHSTMRASQVAPSIVCRMGMSEKWLSFMTELHKRIIAQVAECESVRKDCLQKLSRCFASQDAPTQDGKDVPTSPSTPPEAYEGGSFATSTTLNTSFATTSSEQPVASPMASVANHPLRMELEKKLSQPTIFNEPLIEFIKENKETMIGCVMKVEVSALPFTPVVSDRLREFEALLYEGTCPCVGAGAILDTEDESALSSMMLSQQSIDLARQRKRRGYVAEEEDDSHEMIPTESLAMVRPAAAIEVELPPGREGEATCLSADVITNELRKVKYQTGSVTLDETVLRVVKVALAIEVWGDHRRQSVIRQNVARSVYLAVCLPFVWVPPSSRYAIFQEGTAPDAFRLLSKLRCWEQPHVARSPRGEYSVEPNSGSNFDQATIAVEFTRGYSIDDQIVFVSNADVVWLEVTPEGETLLCFNPTRSEKVVVGRVTKGELRKSSQASVPLKNDNHLMELRIETKRCNAEWLRRILSRLRYTNASPDPIVGFRDVEVRVTDAKGHSSVAVVTIEVLPVDSPTEVILSSNRVYYHCSSVAASLLHYLPRRPSVRVFGDIKLRDVDTDHFAGGFLGVELSTFNDPDSLFFHCPREDEAAASGYRQSDITIGPNGAVFDGGVEVATMEETDDLEAARPIHSLRFAFGMDGATTIKSVERILSCIEFGSFDAEPPVGERVVRIVLQVGTTCGKVDADGAPVVEAIDESEWSDPVASEVTVQVTSSLLSVRGTRWSKEYRTGSGVVKFVAVDMSSVDHDYHNGAIDVSIVSNASEDDAINVILPDDFRLVPRSGAALGASMGRSLRYSPATASLLSPDERRARSVEECFADYDKDLVFSGATVGQVAKAGSHLIMKFGRNAPIKRRHISTLLHSLVYCHRGVASSTKAIMVKVKDAEASASIVLFEIAICGCGAVTQISVQLPTPCRISFPFSEDLLALRGCAQLLPFGEVTLYDPDTQYFDGGSIAAEVVEGVGVDNFRLLEPMEQRLCVTKSTHDLPKLPFTGLFLEGTQLKCIDGSEDVTLGTVSLSLPDPTFDRSHRITITFQTFHPPRFTIPVCEYLLSCIAYDCTTIHEPTEKTFLFSIRDPTNPVDGQMRLDVAFRSSPVRVDPAVVAASMGAASLVLFGHTLQFLQPEMFAFSTPFAHQKVTAGFQLSFTLKEGCTADELQFANAAYNVDSNGQLLRGDCVIGTISSTREKLVLNVVPRKDLKSSAVIEFVRSVAISLGASEGRRTIEFRLCDTTSGGSPTVCEVFVDVSSV